MAAADPVVVEGLNHHYGRGGLRRQILHDITTTIPAGEIVIVTGPSGSGKTTLLTLVGALRSAQEGSVRVLGQQLNGAKSVVPEGVRKHIGFIFQQHNLLGALTASQNVELGLRVTGRFSRADLRRKAGEDTAPPQHSVAAVMHCAAQQVDHQIDLAQRREVLAFIIGPDPRTTERLKRWAAGGRGGRVDLGTRQPGQLDRCPSHAASCGMDQHPLAAGVESDGGRTGEVEAHFSHPPHRGRAWP